MSRLTDLIQQAKGVDPQLGVDLEAEYRALLKRRSFGLVFERHRPEAVDLPQRRVRKGDTVRILPPRGSLEKGDKQLWRVLSVERNDGSGTAHIIEVSKDLPERRSVTPKDLVVVAAFRDPLYPGLVETGRIERGGDKPFHTVINGENFHVLEMLTYTHRHKIDAIYIDPPYNTGAKDWKYNNDYVESDDMYRHSKWLAMMERRLLLAKELLNPENSVLIVTIDEKEYLRLGLLLEQTFPDAEIQMVSSVIKKGGTSRSTHFSRVEEYLFYVFFGIASIKHTGDTMLTEDKSETAKSVKESDMWEGMVRRGIGVIRAQRPKQFYPIYVDPSKGAIVGNGLPLGPTESKDEHKAPEGTVIVWPIKDDGSEGFWQLSPPGLKKAKKQGTVRVGSFNEKTGQWRIQYMKAKKAKYVLDGTVPTLGKDQNGVVIIDTEATVSLDSSTPRTIWFRKAHDASANGAGLLNEMLPSRKFPFPKSLYAVEDALRFFIKDMPDAIVLDFFSGSGTSAHAVMRLNHQDEGQRQCISITNNEVAADEQDSLRREGFRPGDPEWERGGICDYITKPRIQAAITGRTPDGQPIAGDYKFTDEFPMSEGFEENAAFFTLTYEGQLSVSHHRAFDKVAPLLWLRAGSVGRIIYSIPRRGWDIAEAYGVLVALDETADFVNAISGSKTVKIAYIVTDDDRRFQMICSLLPDHVTPIRLYESYLANFEINSGRCA